MRTRAQTTQLQNEAVASRVLNNAERIVWRHGSDKSLQGAIAGTQIRLSGTAEQITMTILQGSRHMNINLDSDQSARMHQIATKRATSQRQVARASTPAVSHAVAQARKIICDPSRLRNL